MTFWLDRFRKDDEEEKEEPPTFNYRQSFLFLLI